MEEKKGKKSRGNSDVVWEMRTAPKELPVGAKKRT